MRLREEICVETAERRGVEAMRDAETTLSLAETREELEAFASEALPRGWTFDARGEAVPGEKNGDGGDGGGDGDGGGGGGGETASHTTPFARCTPFLKDVSRRRSSPALPFQRLTGKTFD